MCLAGKHGVAVLFKASEQFLVVKHSFLSDYYLFKNTSGCHKLSRLYCSVIVQLIREKIVPVQVPGDLEQARKYLSTCNAVNQIIMLYEDVYVSSVDRELHLPN
jgi:hypothetical protein